jgi:hypothetical protein
VESAEIKRDWGSSPRYGTPHEEDDDGEAAARQIDNERRPAADSFGDGTVLRGRRSSGAPGPRADGARNKRGRGGTEEMLHRRRGSRAAGNGAAARSSGRRHTHEGGDG